MKTAYIYCVAAMMFYALEIAITDWKLSNVSPKVLTLFYAIGVAFCAGIALLFSRQVTIPDTSQWGFIAAMILASFLAATAHFAAINQQVGAVTLTIFYCLMPVAASIYMAILKGQRPTASMVIAWILAVVALYLLSRNAE